MWHCKWCGLERARRQSTVCEVGGEHEWLDEDEFAEFMESMQDQRCTQCGIWQTEAWSLHYTTCEAGGEHNWIDEDEFSEFIGKIRSNVERYLQRVKSSLVQEEAACSAYINSEGEQEKMARTIASEVRRINRIMLPFSIVALISIVSLVVSSIITIIRIVSSSEKGIIIPVVVGVLAFIVLSKLTKEKMAPLGEQLRYAQSDKRREELIWACRNRYREEHPKLASLEVAVQTVEAALYGSDSELLHFHYKYKKGSGV